MKRWLRALAGLALAWAIGAQADERPQWELGLGLAVIDFPLYRGAAERRRFLLPAPYVQYHGDFLQVERERVRGLLLRQGRLEVDISLNGSVPVQDAAIRRGMPDLDPAVELGPSFNLRLLSDARGGSRLELRLPMRAVLAVNAGRIERQGWLAQPQLNLALRGLAGWSLGLQGALLYGDRTYHSYFYTVAPQYATLERPAYAAAAGYAGKQILATLSRRQGDLWLGAFVKWDDLAGAVFADSPLVQSRQSFAAGFMVAWVFAKSSRMVEVNGD